MMYHVSKSSECKDPAWYHIPNILEEQRNSLVLVESLHDIIPH